MVFDSVFNSFRGIIAYYRVLNGELKKGDSVRFFNTERNTLPMKLASLGWTCMPQQTVQTGNVGYIISGIKNAKEVKVGRHPHPCQRTLVGRL